MLVIDQIQEIAAAYVSCHTVRERDGKMCTHLCLKEKNDPHDERSTACLFSIYYLSHVTHMLWQRTKWNSIKMLYSVILSSTKF